MIKTYLLGLAIAMLPLSAVAMPVTVVNPNSTLADGGSYDILSAPEFDWSATVGVESQVTDGDMVSFEFTGTTAVEVTVDTIATTTEQPAGSITGFDLFWSTQQDGAGFVFADPPTQEVIVPGGGSQITGTSFVVNPTQLATGAWLNVVWTGVTGLQEINIQVSAVAVPLPAPALLLLGAIAGLGGIGAMRRRKALA